ncbi:carbohydrate ABC transporter permease [soil metagenome]
MTEAVLPNPLKTRRLKTRRRKPSRVIGLSLISIVLTLIAFSTLYPLLFIGFVAFMQPQEYRENRLGIPTNPTFDSIMKVWGDGDFGRYMLNSLLVVGCSVILIVVLGSLAGFAFAHLKYPGLGVSFGIALALMVLPASLFMVPTFKVVLDLHLFNNYLGLILVYASLQVPFGIFMMWTYFQAVPKELFEAARMDGASVFRTFRSVALPLAGPALLTLTTLTFLTLWNELLFSLIILQSADQRTIIVGLSLLKGSMGVENTTVLAAGMLVSALPPLLLFVIFNRQVTSGLVAGAVKS